MARYITLLLALISATSASPYPQAVTSAIAPSATAPSGCSGSFDGQFGMAIQPVSTAAAASASAAPSSPVVKRDFIVPGSSIEKRTIQLVERQTNGSSSTIPTACRSNSTLTMSLADTTMKDDKQRTAYIASNRQFQFDGPPQADAIYTAGFSVCQDGAIALGSSRTFYQCLSGTFYNLYDQSIGGQCEPVNMMAVKLVYCDDGSGAIAKDV